MKRVSVFFILFVSVSVLCVSAHAAPSSSKKKKSVEEELKYVAGDEDNNEIKSLKAELMIGKSDEQALTQLEKLLRKYKGSALEAGLLFRKAELYMRKAKSARFFEVHRENDVVTRFVPAAMKNGSQKQFISKAIEVYQQLERKHSHYRDMDLVLFNDAFSHQLIGKEAEALKLYNRVVHEYSQSALVPDCHLAIGEMYFQKKNYSLAHVEFKKIRQFPDARVYPYGIYKEAWALYNLHEGEKALGNLEEVVAYSKAAQSEGDETNRLDLSKEALTDMVLFFEDVKSASVAVKYFRSQTDDDQVGGLLLRLGAIYQRHGKSQQLETVFTDLIHFLPQVAERPQVHRDLMDAYILLKKPESTLIQLTELSKICEEKSDWLKDKKSEAQKECLLQLQASSLHYATKWHKEYRRDKDLKKSANLALGAYEAWLKFKRVEKDGDDKFRYDYAQLLFERGDFRKASDEYYIVSTHTKEAQMRHDSGYGAILALEKATGDKWTDLDEREFQKKAQSYVKLNPKGQYVTDVRFKGAFIAYEKGRFEDAKPELRRLAVEFSSTERGRKAGHLYLDVLNLQKDYALLRDESFYFVKNLKGLDEKSRVEFQVLYEQSSFKVVEELDKQGKRLEAANGFFRYFELIPNSKWADQALYNSARIFVDLGRVSDSIRSLELLIEKFPTSAEKLSAKPFLVGLYESQLELKKAAALIEQLQPVKWDQLLQAGDYYALSSESGLAKKVYQKVAAQKVDATLSQSALFRIYKLNEREAGTKFLQDLAEGELQPQASLAQHKLLKKAQATEDDEKIFSVAKKLVAMRKDKNVSLHAVAQARLVQAQILEKEFDRSTLKVSKPERLSIVLAIRAEKLGNVQRAYQDTIQLGDRKTAVEALYRLGIVYDKFASSISEVKMPDTWTPVEQKKLRSELENLSVPIEEKTIDTFVAAIKLGKEIGLHDGTIGKIQVEIDRANHKVKNDRLLTDISAPGLVVPVAN